MSAPRHTGHHLVAATTFYLDDSGTRHPDHSPQLPGHRHDWFALGGVLIDDENIPGAEALIDGFRQRWPEMGDAPLHSWEIRGRHGNFKWLGSVPGLFETFARDLEGLLFELPVIGLACVIDRPGYNARYREKYGRQRWALCKTAFAVAVERATKYAQDRGRKLRIYAERTDKTEDRKMQEYYTALRAGGHWFDASSAEKYSPVGAPQYQQTLYEFRTKKKTSRLMQIADLYLWPMCMGGYHPANFPYSRLKAAGKFIDCVIPSDEIATRGIKYSCFELVGQNN